MEGLPIDTSHPAVRDYLALIRYVLPMSSPLICKPLTSPCSFYVCIDRTARSLQVLTPLSLLINIATVMVCSLVVSPGLGPFCIHQSNDRLLTFSSASDTSSRRYLEIIPHLDIARAEDDRRVHHRDIHRPDRVLYTARPRAQARDKGARRILRTRAVMLIARCFVGVVWCDSARSCKALGYHSCSRIG